MAGEQVLVCPDCQRAHDWTADLDRCRACGGTALVRALGETRCRACGAVGDGESAAAGRGETVRQPDESLPAAVAAALARIRRGPAGGGEGDEGGDGVDRSGS